MTPTIKPLTKRKPWKVLSTHYKTIRGFHLRRLFADDPKRGRLWGCNDGRACMWDLSGI